jgi:hypothetical protein
MARSLQAYIRVVIVELAVMSETYVQELQRPVVRYIPPRAAEAGSAVKFGKNNEFQAELKRRVDEFFWSTGRRRRDVPQMYLKTAIILGLFAFIYFLLVFVAQTWWQALPLAVMLGLTTSGSRIRYFPKRFGIGLVRQPQRGRRSGFPAGRHAL